MTRELQLIYGGQWGSEGKGQMCAYLARLATALESDKKFIAVRVGGPNAGHTIMSKGNRVRKMQQIPVAAMVSEKVIPVIGATGLINPIILKREIEWRREEFVRPNPDEILLIDHQAKVVTEEHMAREQGLAKDIASTGKGGGAATADTVMRIAQTFGDWIREDCPSEDVPFWSKNVAFSDTIDFLHVWENATIQIEGTQGYLLSLNTSRNYPYVTSRDCSPEAIMGQVGMSFRHFDDARVIGVYRTHPIRVGGPSGELPNEVTWDYMMGKTRGYIETPEQTTVTLKDRRIAEWGDATAEISVTETCPTEVLLSFLDYEFPFLNNAFLRTVVMAEGQTTASVLNVLSDRKVQQYIYDREDEIDHYIRFVSVGPGMIIDRLEMEAKMSCHRPGYGDADTYNNTYAATVANNHIPHFFPLEQRDIEENNDV